ncbi:peptidase M15B and M15C DD-carboxypeptidase VanY/endolysin [Xylanimonas cellulosilytica DSM 15894]|uniref:Peptidase M15B and M15C DD-carboxypeptidase VanY/endolysin n=1 Tax=Xylanimonas cellulosilytica (strain DSM 15894 / JCM 12276 / CECT 5975 / KCTC 9989 / LMG 20990 / NBRC 107835 / XIL07) TaxID=446471 RepID=D1BZV5_XYLCX|nr:M15 family metallopeptidase [Xylanimonas cellulosilytica]ACZ32083.1 peptidase M15B and M15C DD-carboxypeptidase VanY/endolysin [Xylanimonas cellulosilytica DSM 15894]
MPQHHPSRATQRQTRIRRRTRTRAISTGVATATVAALAATTAVPGAMLVAKPVVSKSSTASKGVTVPSSTAVGAEFAGVHAEAVAAVVTQASGALAEAEHITSEGVGAPAETMAQIEQTTHVVRELVRRVSSIAEAAQTVAATTPEPVSPSALPADDAEEVANEVDLDADATALEDAAEAAQKAATDAAILDAAILDAADAAVTAVVGEGTPTDAAEPAAVATALEQQTAALTELIASTPAGAIAVTPAPPSPEEIAAQKAAEAAADSARLAALAEEAMQYDNGRIPEHLLSELAWSPGDLLRADAAAQLARLNEAFAAHFGRDLSITDSYRSFADQVAVKRSRGKWAAVPGYSNHGFGVAVDLGGGIADFSSAEYQWMRAHAGDFGWENPEWAQQGGRKPEAWHWEYAG